MTAHVESDLMRQIQVAASRNGWRLFRNNVGVFWTGTAVRLKNGDVLLKNARRVRTGLCTGSSDLIGWTSSGRFAAVEVKTKTGRSTAAQMRFIKVVRAAMGHATIARSIEDVFPSTVSER